MAKDDFEFKQFERYVKNFEKASKELETFLKTFLLQQAQRCIASVKRKTPVDTGALRASWGIGKQKIVLKSIGKTGKVTLDAKNSTVADINVVGDMLEVTIFNNMDYASYVEFGHRAGADTWVKGYFMLTISISEVQRAIPARFEKAFEQFLKERGVV